MHFYDLGLSFAAITEGHLEYDTHFGAFFSSLIRYFGCLKKSQGGYLLYFGCQFHLANKWYY